MFTRTTALSLVELKSSIVREPLTVSPDVRVIDAIAQMSSVRAYRDFTQTENTPLDDLHLEVRSSCVVVVDAEQVVGILTTQDVVRLSAQQQPLDRLVMRQVMAHPVVTLRESEFTHLLSAIDLLQQHRIHHLPIVDEQARLVGLVTQASVRQAATHQHLQKELNKRQHIEALLLESEQRYASLIAAAPVGIFRSDAMGRCTYVNDHYCQITGLTLESVFGDGWQQGLHPEDRAWVIAAWSQAVRAERSFQLEHRYLHPDGGIRWVYTQSMAERDAAGRVVGYVGTLIDISERARLEAERKQAEAALRESETRWQFALEGAGDGVWDWNTQTNTVFFSPQWKAMLGYADHEVGNHLEDWDDRAHPEDKAQCYVDLNKHISGETPIYQNEHRVRCKDGSYKWILARGKVIEWSPDGKPLRIIGTHTDISDRKRAEAALRQSELTNRIIIETIPDLLIQMDWQGNYSRMLGGSGVRVKYPSASSTKPEVHDVLPPPLAEQRLYYTNQALESGRLQIYEQNFDVDGEQRCEEVRIAPLNEQEVLVIIRDITERKKAERQLQNLISGTAATTGQNFFPALVSHIVDALNVSHALVTEQVGDKLRTLGFWANDALRPTYTYNLRQTPCERVLQAGEFYCECSVQQMFPEDLDLVEMEAESYLGVALHDAQGKVIGHLCILNKQPIRDPQRAEQILQVFAARAAAELERQRTRTSLEQLNQALEAKVEERTIALQEREARYRALVDVIPDLLIRLHADGTYLDVISGSGVKLFDPERIKAGVNIYDVTSFEHAHQRMVYARQALRTREVQFYEYEVILDGELRFEEARIVAIQAEEVLVIVRDITDRKAAEKALRESQQFLQTVLDTFPLSVFWKDRNLIYQGCNRNFMRDAGLTSVTDIIGKTDYDLPWRAAEAEAYRAGDRDVMDAVITKIGIVETQLQADGNQVWLETNKLPLHNLRGEVVGVLGTYQDITDRKQAEAQIRSLLNRTQLLNRISSEIRDSLDLDIILQTSVNAIFSELSADICTFAWHQEDDNINLWEVIKEQKIPDLPSWIGSYQLDQFPELLNHILEDRVYRVDRLETLGDRRLKAALAAVNIEAYLCLPIHTVGGKVGSLQLGRISNEHPWQDEEIKLLQDIGNQVAIAIYQAQLYEESQAKTKKLRQSYQELKGAQLQLIQSEKMSSLGQLVAGIAHEINNPMSFIYGNLTLASDYAEDLANLIRIYQENYPNPPQAISDFTRQADIGYTLDDFPKLLASMETGATRIRDIVQSLRTFSRLDQSNYKAVDIHENIDNTLVILQNRLNGRAGKPEIQVIKNYGELPLIECYSGLLNQVIMNLLVNAIDAIEEKQVNAASGYSGYIAITTATVSDGKINISIQDNGTGILPETQAKIFNPFFTTKPTGVGTGMGLSISYQIVTGDHQGWLSCHSVPGEGTEFVIELWQSIPYGSTKAASSQGEADDSNVT
ncbi:MAG: PAS domain S-box protein [Leptolyngbya sp. SIO1E4]|nr:PAS domain S-box protein [Leptolyngbya sp. SIO1E4]